MVILLDIDGVMVTTPSWKKNELDEDGFLKFNEKATRNLARLISETRARIVLTSTHRISFSNQEWMRIFNKRGIPVTELEKINSVKTLTEMKQRGEEIKDWIDNSYSGDRYVILDDDLSINALPEEIKENWVMTKPMIGLNDEAMIQALKILKIS